MYTYCCSVDVVVARRGMTEIGINELPPSDIDVVEIFSLVLTNSMCSICRYTRRNTQRELIPIL